MHPNPFQVEFKPDHSNGRVLSSPSKWFEAILWKKSKEFFPDSFDFFQTGKGSKRCILQRRRCSGSRSRRRFVSGPKKTWWRLRGFPAIHKPMIKALLSDSDSEAHRDLTAPSNPVPCLQVNRHSFQVRAWPCTTMMKEAAAGEGPCYCGDGRKRQKDRAGLTRENGPLTETTPSPCFKLATLPWSKVDQVKKKFSSQARHTKLQYYYHFKKMPERTNESNEANCMSGLTRFLAGWDKKLIRSISLIARSDTIKQVNLNMKRISMSPGQGRT